MFLKRILPKGVTTFCIIVTSLSLLTACEPEVGSKEWCEKMDKKPKGEWTLNESKDYVKHCVIRND